MAPAQRRTELERGLIETDEAIQQVRQDGVTAKAVQQTLARVHELYAALQPHEQKELIGPGINGDVAPHTAVAGNPTLQALACSPPPVGLRDQDSNLEPIG